MVRDAVNARRPEVTLECDNRLSGRLVEFLGAVDLIAVGGKRPLDLSDLWTLITRTWAVSLAAINWLDPMPDTGRMQPRPRKLLPRIVLPARRHVGVGEHAMRQDRRMASQNVPAQRDDGFDLRLGEIRVAVAVARVDDLDSD